MDWDDARIFLAVAEAGTLTAAAGRLGLSQPTVGRRLQALERRLAAHLFQRTGTGLRLTPAGEAVLAPARQMAEAAASFARRAGGRDATLAGAVRLSVTEGLGVNWLPGHLLDFHARHPEIAVELHLDNAPVNLLRREADVALRLVAADLGRPAAAQDSLMARRVGGLSMALYAASSYLARRGRPADLAGLAGHDAILPAGEPAFAHFRWFAGTAGAMRPVLRTDSLAAQLAAARAGWGIALLARPVGDQAHELERLLPAEPTPRLDAWLLWHADQRDVARVRALLDFLADLMHRERPAMLDAAAERGTVLHAAGAQC